MRNTVTAAGRRADTGAPPVGAAKAQDGREFEFTSSDFEVIRDLIYARAGITLSPVKVDMVYSRIARRLRALGMRRFQDYLSFLKSGRNEAEWQEFTNALTTNLTSFFREMHHFPLLADHLAARRGRDVAIWCCAASTGEEPYSIAMTVAETYGAFDVPVEIVASDLDTNVLQKAKDGVYPLERVEKISQEQVRRFFKRGSGAQEGNVKVRQELNRMVTFRQVNLLSDPLPLKGPFDVIFCRNVMIYFDKPTQADVVRRLSQVMKPDGLLFVGHSESLLHVSDTVKLRGKTVYERVSARSRNDP
ncbi:MAG: CheR family methyltransferase [Betaproteobacteria bacterium]